MRQQHITKRWMWLALLLMLVLAQGIVHASSYSDAIVASAPETYYRLGDSSGTTAVDASGHSHDGTYHNGISLGATGAIQGDADTAISLDGSDDYVSLPGLTLQNRSFSVEAWIKPASSPPAQQAIFTAADSAFTDVAIFRVYSAGHLAFSYASETLAASSVITFGAWHHVVYTYDYAADISILYVDGTARASNSAGPYTASSVDYLNLASTVGGDFFKGDLDEVAIYFTVLSSADVVAHYETAGYSIPATPTPTATVEPTQTSTPTPAPWALATLPANGQTYQVSYEVSVGDAMQFVALLIVIVLSFIQMLIAMANRR
jgi:hypothetical protein